MALALSLGACTREVANGLDEASANRGVVALAHAGIDAEKVPDPQAEGHFRIVVARDEATPAISVLAAEELPRAPTPAGKESGLMPSPEAERAARVAQTAAQIEHTLASVEGVLDARVHLDVPTVDPLAAAVAPEGKTMPHPTASVLVRHRGKEPPLSGDEVRKLVAGAVSGMAPGDVSVVFAAVSAPAVAGDRDLAHVGPIAVARSSMNALRGVAAGALALIAVLAVIVLMLAGRLRRAQLSLAELAAPARGRRPMREGEGA
jgi:type III secretion protein J